MKKLLTASLTALALTASASSFASVSQDETAYLFGTQDVIEMQMISNVEMQATEGQLFGITMDTVKTYMGKAIEYIKPFAKSYALKLKDKAITYFKARLDGYLANLNAA